MFLTSNHIYPNIVYHILTNHNSSCGKLWHKVVPNLVSLALLLIKLLPYKKGHVNEYPKSVGLQSN